MNKFKLVIHNIIRKTQLVGKVVLLITTCFVIFYNSINFLFNVEKDTNCYIDGHKIQRYNYLELAKYDAIIDSLRLEISKYKPLYNEQNEEIKTAIRLRGSGENLQSINNTLLTLKQEIEEVDSLRTRLSSIIGAINISKRERRIFLSEFFIDWNISLFAFDSSLIVDDIGRAILMINSNVNSNSEIDIIFSNEYYSRNKENIKHTKIFKTDIRTMCFLKADLVAQGLNIISKNPNTVEQEYDSSNGNIWEWEYSAARSGDYMMTLTLVGVNKNLGGNTELLRKEAKVQIREGLVSYLAKVFIEFWYIFVGVFIAAFASILSSKYLKKNDNTKLKDENMSLVKIPPLPSYPCEGPNCDQFIRPSEAELMRGIKQYYCSKCGFEDTLIIPPEDYVNWRKAHTPINEKEQ